LARSSAPRHAIAVELGCRVTWFCCRCWLAAGAVNASRGHTFAIATTPNSCGIGRVRRCNVADLVEFRSKCSLLAIFFIADWYMSMAPTQIVTSREAEKPIIRIKTDRKWPERIVFDTSAPTIVPQKPPAVADAPVHQSPARSLCPAERTGTGRFSDPTAG
jgi:hypothetical protein